MPNPLQIWSRVGECVHAFPCFLKVMEATARHWQEARWWGVCYSPVESPWLKLLIDYKILSYWAKEWNQNPQNSASNSPYQTAGDDVRPGRSYHHWWKVKTNSLSEWGTMDFPATYVLYFSFMTLPSARSAICLVGFWDVRDQIHLTEWDDFLKSLRKIVLKTSMY